MGWYTKLMWASMASNFALSSLTKALEIMILPTLNHWNWFGLISSLFGFLIGLYLTYRALRGKLKMG